MQSRFFADQSGGVAPLFALGLVPMIGLAGAAIDYSRANAARTAMQATLDTAALMVAKDAQIIQPA
ncbi:MAG TPA: pilus assembly protein TadG-related protein, partial [Xanthobacteraceae bacterium]|nr:pilus assembly protein TadG-related protein [Xanthobacteraceae bacterium]